MLAVFGSLVHVGRPGIRGPRPWRRWRLVQGLGRDESLHITNLTSALKCATALAGEQWYSLVSQTALAKALGNTCRNI